MSDQLPPVSPSGPSPAWGEKSEPGAPADGTPPPPPAAYPAYPAYPPAYGQGGQQPFAPSPYGIQPPTHPQATTALILGIVGIAGVVLTPVFFVTILAGICSPFAIWLGARAKREIKAEPQRYSGEGLATAGFVTGIVGLVLGVLILVVAVLIAVLFVGLLSSM